MVGTVALGLVGGLIASKVLFRRRFRHHHHHHPHPPFGRFRRWHRDDTPPAATRPPVKDAQARLGALLAPLELGQSQATEAREAFADVAMALGAAWQKWSGLEEVLAAAGSEPFDVARARAAVDGLAPEPARLVVDAVEHFHNILLPEQRQRLAAELAKQAEWR